MAYSYQRATSDGTMTFIDISIDYLDRSEISVYFDDVLTTAWSWSGSVENRILFSPAVPHGTVVEVRRITDASQLRHEFSKGAAFTAEYLDEDLKQALHMAQEASEANLVGDFFTDINMHGFRVYNVGPAVDDNDVLTLAQYKADASGAAASAAAAADAAADALAAAADAEAAAASAANAVNVYATLIAGASGSANVGFQQSGTGAAIRTVQAELRERVSVSQFTGVDLTGTTDSTTGMNNAEAAAFARGAILTIPAGSMILYTGSFNTRVSVEGNGSTIKQNSSTTIAGNVAGTVVAAASGLTFTRLTVDSNLKNTGFAADGKNDLMFRECKAMNCLNLGFGIYGGDHVELWGCTATNVRYYQTGVAGGAADPFYFGGCTRSRWIGCIASNFRRIGFVSEGNGPVKSNQIQAWFCLASNANNCDDSTTEYNAGMWAENTNSVDWMYCIATDISTGVGQTSGRVVGIWGLGLGNDSQGTVNIIGCRVFAGAQYLPAGIRAEGSLTYANLNVENCYVNRVRIGFQSGCGLFGLAIRNFRMEDINVASAAQGGLLFDNGGTAALPNLLIDGVSATNATWHASSGIVNFFQGISGCDFTVRNIKGNVPFVMRGNVARLLAENCVLTAGTALQYPCFLAADLTMVDCKFTSRNQTGLDYIFNSASMASGSVVSMRNCVVTGYTAGWNPEVGGVNIRLFVSGCRFDGFCFPISGTGTFQSEFVDNTFDNVPPTIGSIRTNFNSPTRQRLIVKGNQFYSNNVADTPIRLWNTNPQVSALFNNGFNATVLHNLASGVTAANNYTL